MRCIRCRKEMKRAVGMRFDGHSIDGWKCSCGERYYDSGQANRILLLNKLKKQAVKAKLGRIRSNLILRVPKDVEQALELRQGEDVLITVDKGAMRVRQA